MSATKKPKLITAEEHIAMQEEMYRRVMREVVALMESASKPSKKEQRESLLNYFACSALATLLQRENEVKIKDRGHYEKRMKAVAEVAYEYAAAMLEARSK